MSRRQRLTLLAAILGSGVATIDGTIVNVALPAIEEDLGGGLSAQQWVSNAYLLALGSLILIGGSLGDIYGERRVFAIGLAAFGVLSLACALAPTIEVLIGARALQGAAGALVTPSSLAIIVAAFGPGERGAAIGSWTAWGGIAAIVGPLAGGLIVDQASWRWIFALNVPLALATLVLVRAAVPETTRAATRRVDFVGAGLCVLGLGGIVFALIEQPNHGWSSPVILVPLVGGIAALAAFLAYERRTPQPMLKLELFSRRNFAVGNLETLAVYAGLAILFFFLVIYLQQAAGYGALESGLTTLPVTIVLFALSRRFGALADRYGPRLFMGAGPLLSAGGILLLLRVGLDPSYLTDLLPALLVFSLGLALTVAPLTATVLADADETDAGIASAINNAVARVAGLVGVSVVGVVVAGHARRRHVRRRRRVGGRVPPGRRDLRGARRRRRRRRRDRDRQPAASRRGGALPRRPAGRNAGAGGGAGGGPVVVRTRRPEPEEPAERRERAEKDPLDGRARPDEADLVLELAQDEGQPQRVPGDSRPDRLAGLREAGQRLERDLGPERRPEVDEHVDVVVARVPRGVGLAGRNDDHLARAVDALDSAGPEAERAAQDLEALLLQRMHVIGTGRPAGAADPVDLEQLAGGRLGGLAEDRPQLVAGFQSSAPASSHRLRSHSSRIVARARYRALLTDATLVSSSSAVSFADQPCRSRRNNTARCIGGRCRSAVTRASSTSLVRTHGDIRWSIRSRDLLEQPLVDRLSDTAADLPPLEGAQARVRSDAVEPRPEGGAALKRLAAGPGAQERLLGQVLRVLVRAEHPVRVRVELAAMTVEELA